MMNFFTKLLTPVFIALGMVNPTPVIETTTPDVQVQQELIELSQKTQEVEYKQKEVEGERKEKKVEALKDSTVVISNIQENRDASQVKQVFAKNNTVLSEEEEIDLLLESFIFDRFKPLLIQEKNLTVGLREDLISAVDWLNSQKSFMERAYDESDKSDVKEHFKMRSLVQYNYQKSLLESQIEYINSLLEYMDNTLSEKDSSMFKKRYDEISGSFDGQVVIDLVYDSRNGKAMDMINISSFFFLGSKFFKYNCTEDCGGHEAGYEWAFLNSISSSISCDGNSQSFIEGCIAYTKDKLFK